jgi:hypothetical protein
MKISDISNNYTIAISSIEQKNISDENKDKILLDYTMGRLWNKSMDEYLTNSIYTDIIEINKIFITPYKIGELRLKYLEILKNIIEIKKDLSTPIEINDNNTDSSDDNDMLFNLTKLPEDHLIRKYVKYGEQTQDAYPEYHFINIMTLLSYILPARQTPAYGFTYNNVWMIGLGVAGVSGKTTTVEKLQEVIDVISSSSYVKRMPTKPTPEAYVDELSSDGCNKQIWINDECVGLMKFMEREYASELEDNILKTYSHSSFSSLTKKNGLKEVNNPHLPMLWYTTIENFARHSKYEKYESGFLQRPMYVLPKRKKINKKDRRITSEDELLFKDILLHCIKLYDLSTKFKYIDFEESEIINNWKLEEREKISDIKGDINRGARTRSYEHVRKLAMLITIGSREFMENIPTYKSNDNGQLSLPNYIPDWAALLAIEWTKIFMNNFDKIYRISITNNGGNIQKIMQMLQENEYVKKIDLMDLIRKYGKQFDELMGELIYNGVVQIVSVNSHGKGRPGIYYQIKKEV